MSRCNAAAEQGFPSQPATFGAGPHACPAAAHAVAMTRGIVSALRADGWQLVPGSRCATNRGLTCGCQPPP